MFVFLFFDSSFVYSQLIDNRDLPSERLRIKPPFVPTDRSEIRTKDEKEYFILDNADDINIQNFPDDDIVEVTMLGNVRIRFDGNFIKAERLIISLKDSVIINVGAFGRVEFTLNGTKYLVDSVNYQPDMERGIMYNARSVLGGGLSDDDKPWFYRAERVTILSADRFVLDNVSLTTSEYRFDHYQLKVSKLWYIQDKVALALGMQYITGQSSFFWLPAFFQIENAGNLRTSFGNERNIGYYFINNYDIDTIYGDFDIGFDFYERQGQYFQFNYEAPSTGILQEFNAEVSLANDIRLTRNGSLYSQWVVPVSGSTDYQRINQFAWYYNFGIRLGASGISLGIDVEDLNDPFFRSKYSYRTRFDSTESVDFISLVSPFGNSWYDYSGDSSPGGSGTQQRVTLTMGNFTMSGSWEMIRTNPETGNPFLNDFYDYELRSLTLPQMSYDFGSLEIADYEYKSDSTVTVVDSNGRKSEMFLHRFEDFKRHQEQRSNMIISNVIVMQGEQEITNRVTNWEPIEFTNVTTNSYTWFDVNLTASARVEYKAQQTFGTNTIAETTDTSQLTDDRVLVADAYNHTETGDISLNMYGLNNIISLKNGLSMRYHEQWSSFASQETNDARASGFDLNYNLGFSLNPSKTWFEDELIRTKINYQTTITFIRPLYRFRRDEKGLSDTETSFSINNSFDVEYLQWRRESLLGLTMKVDYSFKERIKANTQNNIPDPTDVIIDDITFEQVTAGAGVRVWWAKLSAEVPLNIQKTTTNRLLTDSFTNRLVGGFPKLVLEFKPNSDYHYIPSLTYRYNLFEKGRSDNSADVDLLWNLKFQNYQIPALYPFIYELTDFGFTFRYFQDFINPRNSFLQLDFSIGVKFTKYLTFKFSSRMLNSKVYLYFDDNGSYLSGEGRLNFFEDLWDGLQFWNIEALKRSNFKLQSLNFELIHDLDTWDMRLIFNLGRRIDEIRQVAYWEPFIGISFTMRGSNAVNLFPEYNRSFIPLEFQ